MESMECSREKIPDTDLRDFVKAGGHNGRRSVIVELGVDPVPIEPRDPLGPPMIPAPRKDQVASRDDLINIEGNAASMKQLEDELVSLGLGRDLVRLEAAQAFVLTVTPDDLRAVARLPLVGVIRPNRVHRVRVVGKD
jgi:hypothetical protein